MREGVSGKVISAVVITITMLGTGCAARQAAQLTSAECTTLYTRGYYERLAERVTTLEGLDATCRRRVLRALVSADPSRLLEVSVETGEPNLVVAAALAAGMDGSEPEISRKVSRVLERSRDGRLLLRWLRTGELEVAYGGKASSRELVTSRREVARLLRQGAEEGELRPALRRLAMRTEQAIHEDAFDVAVPVVPIRPRTRTVQGLAAKLAIAPYLDTPSEQALDLIVMTEEGN